ncbi:uncharacterized protein LOC3291225 [Anopheles gambiae]|uniref:uncharacterized protein LOC3291225 n=1 Tax=Anopheles gambiae TaxID=7165 RepID=UPI002AC9D0DC|nr:uncharacterized protein LOC3291225 [Anopheles gambiae]
MPYTLVETTTPTGGKELLAAPAAWIQKKADGTAYLCWPFARSIRKLNTLFQDEYSIPSEVWERLECEILCRNILSLSSADKMIETMESSWLNEPKPAARVTVQRSNDPFANRLSNGGVQKLLSSPTAEPDDDPLGDVKPCPQMLDLLYELKSLILANQEELRQNLKEGFGRVDKSVKSMNDKYLESNAVQYELGRADANAFQAGRMDANVCQLVEQPEKFKVDLLTEMEAVEEFEKRLKDDDYRTQVCQWIDASVGHMRQSEHRMHTLLDLIIDRKLFAGFSWTGGGKNKRALNVHKNILNLFEYAGTTSVYRADHVSVGNFMRKKLQNSTSRIKAKGVRRSVPLSRRKRLNRVGDEIIRIIPKQIKLTSSTDAQSPAAVADATQGQSSPSSSILMAVSVPAKPIRSGTIVVKQDATMFIDGVNEFEEMLDIRRLQK